MYVRLRTFAPLRKNPATSGRGDAELPRMRLRACADRLATFHICRFSERLNGLLIAHWHIRYPPIRAGSKNQDITKQENDVADGDHDLVDCAWLGSRGDPQPDVGFGEPIGSDTVVDCSNRDDQ